MSEEYYGFEKEDLKRIWDMDIEQIKNIMEVYDYLTGDNDIEQAAQDYSEGLFRVYYDDSILNDFHLNEDVALVNLLEDELGSIKYIIAESNLIYYFDYDMFGRTIRVEGDEYRLLCPCCEECDSFDENEVDDDLDENSPDYKNCLKCKKCIEEIDKLTDFELADLIVDDIYDGDITGVWNWEYYIDREKLGRDLSNDIFVKVERDVVYIYYQH